MLQKWVEIGNSGMFRPEMLEPMGFPKDVRVHGWGIGLERPTMIRCVLVEFLLNRCPLEPTYSKVWNQQYQNSCRAQDTNRECGECTSCHVLGAMIPILSRRV